MNGNQFRRYPGGAGDQVWENRKHLTNAALRLTLIAEANLLRSRRCRDGVRAAPFRSFGLTEGLCGRSRQPAFPPLADAQQPTATRVIGLT